MKIVKIRKKTMATVGVYYFVPKSASCLQRDFLEQVSRWRKVKVGLETSQSSKTVHPYVCAIRANVDSSMVLRRNTLKD